MPEPDDMFEFELDINPQFLSTDDLIKEANEWLEAFPKLMSQLETDSSTKRALIEEKIARLREELSKLDDNLWKKKRDLYDKRDRTRKELGALNEAKAREAMADQFAKTEELIREIVAEFATWKQARAYQVEDVISIVHQYVIGSTGVMNANEMALGKTFESIVALYIISRLFKQEHGRVPTVLWLTKSSIIKTGGTVRELQRWDNSYNLIPLDGSDKPSSREFAVKMASKGKYGLITNYEACKTTKAVKQVKWDIVIMDEVHKLKGGANPSGPTDVWKSVKEVTKNSRFIMMLTGTPFVNRAEEMWSYLNIFDEDAFPSASDFAKRFTGFKSAAGHFKLTIDSDKLLGMAMKGRLIRRTAAEIGLQLPQVIREDVYLEHNPQQAEIYQQMREKFFIWLETTNKPLTATNILTQLIRLRQINVLPVAKFKNTDEYGEWDGTYITLDVRDSSKLDAVVERIVEHDVQSVGFCTFNEPLNELAFRLQVEGKRVAVISSATSNQMGDYEVGFQNGEIDVLLINSAMGEGLNLHRDPEKWTGGAGYGFTLDRWYNNARNDQCFKRIVRPGAPGPIFFDDFYVVDSVDEYIRMLCDEKDEQFNTVTDSSLIRPREEIREMMEKLL